MSLSQVLYGHDILDPFSTSEYYMDRWEKRDGRYRSRMGADIKMVDARLDRWGVWIGGQFSFLGLPRETLLAKVARQGFVGASQAGPLPDMPADVQEIEKIVCTFKQIDRSVLIEHYGHHQPIEVSARRRHMSPSCFRKRLERLRKSVQVYIEAHAIVANQLDQVA